MYTFLKTTYVPKSRSGTTLSSPRHSFSPCPLPPDLCRHQPSTQYNRLFYKQREEQCSTRILGKLNFLHFDGILLGLSPHPPRHLQVPVHISVPCAGAHDPRAVSLFHPSQQLQMPTRSGGGTTRSDYPMGSRAHPERRLTRTLTPPAVALPPPEPLQRLQVLTLSGVFTPRYYLIRRGADADGLTFAQAHNALQHNHRRRRRTAHTPAAPTPFTSPALRRPPPSLRGDAPPVHARRSTAGVRINSRRGGETI